MSEFNPFIKCIFEDATLSKIRDTSWGVIDDVHLPDTVRSRARFFNNPNFKTLEKEQDVFKSTARSLGMITLSRYILAGRRAWQHEQYFPHTLKGFLAMDIAALAVKRSATMPETIERIRRMPKGSGKHIAQVRYSEEEIRTQLSDYDELLEGIDLIEPHRSFNALGDVVNQVIVRHQFPIEHQRLAEFTGLGAMLDSRRRRRI